jgi:multidrug efflux system membrane fusion protein
MAFGLKGSHIVAVLIAGGVIGWMLQGDIIVGGQAGSDNATPPPAERANAALTLQKVRFTTIASQERTQVLSLRGRTEADSIVQIRAETSGIVKERLIEKGQQIEVGDLLCRLDVGVRQSAILQAETNLTQAETDLTAASELQKQGYTTNTRLLSLRTARDAAKSQLDQASRELEKTSISAITSGIAQDPIAQVGNLLNPGDICVTIVQTNPMKFIGQVSEQKVSAIATGDPAMISLVSGTQVQGVIKYIAPTADPQTRTFRVEIEMPNNDNLLRDGITAKADIALQADKAFQVRSSWLTLSDNGDIGVRVLDEKDVVVFMPVRILAQTAETMWVNGLKEGERIITLGQEYVTVGQKVIAVDETAQLNAISAETNS